MKHLGFKHLYFLLSQFIFIFTPFLATQSWGMPQDFLNLITVNDTLNSSSQSKTYKGSVSQMGQPLSTKPNEAKQLGLQASPPHIQLKPLSKRSRVPSFSQEELSKQIQEFEIKGLWLGEKTWHDAFYYCQQKGGHLPGRHQLAALKKMILQKQFTSHTIVVPNLRINAIFFGALRTESIWLDEQQDTKGNHRVALLGTQTESIHLYAISPNKTAWALCLK